MARDANGTFVGEVLDFEPPTARYRARIVYRADPLQAAYFETAPLVVLTVSQGGLMFGGEDAPKGVYFTGADCTGTPYIYSHSTWGVPKLFNQLPNLQVEETGSGQVMYVPVDPAETPTTVTTRSELVESLQCYNSVDQGVPVTVTRDDVTEATEVFLNFQPPYTIGY